MNILLNAMMAITLAITIVSLIESLVFSIVLIQTIMGITQPWHAWIERLLERSYIEYNNIPQPNNR